ncbi:hypothetical protein OL548_11580 [Lysinibacillus sp. MHQ-1]|nr:hypothetical protein OL548_11580 [Lysinibacillus sp. MHQ-1]
MLPVEMNESLENTARMHSEDMKVQKFFIT